MTTISMQSGSSKLAGDQGAPDHRVPFVDLDQRSAREHELEDERGRRARSHRVAPRHERAIDVAREGGESSRVARRGGVHPALFHRAPNALDELRVGAIEPLDVGDALGREPESLAEEWFATKVRELDERQVRAPQRRRERRSAQDPLARDGEDRRHDVPGAR